MCGDAFKKIELGQATWTEYFGASSTPFLPTSFIPHITNMAVTWDWPVCRRWFEKVFQMLVDGRLRTAGKI